MTKSLESQVDDTEIEMLGDEVPLAATSLKLRAPIPSGPDVFTEGLKRHDGGWLLTDSETQGRYWVPDANVLMVVLGSEL
jgi:hypothetical protein